MTDGVGTAGGDLQRPLDESLPVDAGARPYERASEPAGDEIPAGGETPAGGKSTPTAETPGDGDTAEENTAEENTGEANTSEEDTGEAVAPRPGVPATGESTGETVPLRTAVPAQAAPATALIDLDAAAARAAAARVVRHARTWPPVRAARVVGRAPVRAGHAAFVWSRRPSGRFAVPGIVLTTLVAAAVTAGALLIPRIGTAEEVAATAPPPIFGTAVPTGAPVLPGTIGPVVPGVGGPTGVPPTGFPPVAANPIDALTGWAQTTSTLTGIPMIALRAYGYAELVMATAMPACQLRWTTLAAIGQVESNHGSTGGATLLASGQALPAIRGPALDGTNGNLLIQDTDGGQLDLDQVYDRAVGPMQFIPQTWYTQADPTRGISDVNNINDAALAAGYYLCGDSRNLSTAEGWRAAILSYNNVETYANAVFGYANQYGQRSRTGAA